MVIVIQAQPIDIEIAQLEDGQYFASMPAYVGCWGMGDTEEAAADECIEVWREWQRLVEETNDGQA